VTPLPYGLTETALAAAEAEDDPASLAAASRLRARFGPQLAAEAVSQAVLRRRARTKFGQAAATMIFTRDGLEQATRPEVAEYHARHFVAAGVRRVVDLGCGLGADSLALAAAGLEVLAVEIDPKLAEAARYNAAGRYEVILGDAEEVAEDLLRSGDGAFCDPARRTSSGRVWRVEDFRPSWRFVTSLLTRPGVAVVKLGPALPHALIPPDVHAEWVSHGGEVVEVCLSSAGAGRSAIILPDHRLEVPDRPPELAVSVPLRYLYEPVGAVIRAGGVPVVGALLGASLLDRQIAYLTADDLVGTPFATPFRVLEVLPYNEKVLRRWLAAHDIGTLEIKKRGLELDPAELRRRLRPPGSRQATFILTRTIAGARVLVAERVA
jgi:SAM-dependent methyltransferase